MMEISFWPRLLTPILAPALFFWGLIAIGGRVAQGAGSPVMGGPCEYKNYKGKAQIISIHSVILPGETGTPLEVKFSFQPEIEIVEPFAQPEGRIFLLTMKNGTFPGQRFLDKYRIATGRSFDCILKVIIRGTCTPTVFEFPDIDLGDYEPR